MALDELKDEDMKVEAEEFEFAVEDVLSENFASFTVDYSDNWLRRGFSVYADGVEKASC